jgi:hypothetical protein
MQSEAVEKQNPFLIDVEDKDDYIHDEYLSIQAQLDAKKLDGYLEKCYEAGKMTTPLSELKRRILRGVNMRIVDPSMKEVPQIQQFTVGDGGDGRRCFVCYTSLFMDRHDASKRILQSLNEVGYNGHFLLLNGGFPNPTGQEMKYVGVPYSFKIFMMLEAAKRGFDFVLWIDACCYAVNNVDNLFSIVEKNDAFFRSYLTSSFRHSLWENMVLPNALASLSTFAGRDIRSDPYCINTVVFGLNFDSVIVRKLVEDYYALVSLGVPFLSEFPEETVFAVFFNSPPYRHIFEATNNFYHTCIHEHDCDLPTAKHLGYVFVQRAYA